MTNRKRTEILDIIIDTLIFNGAINRNDLPKETGLSDKTIDEWIEFITKIQAMPKLNIISADDGMILSLDMLTPEDAQLQNALAFFNSESVRKFIDVMNESEQ